MGATGHYIAAGLFMIATSVFAGNAQNARGDEGIIPGIGAAFSALMAVVFIAWGIIASIRERTKGQP